MAGKLARMFKGPEIFILLTVVFLLLLAVAMMLAQSYRADRDAERKSELAAFERAANLFFQDYGFYPNYSMRLGLGKKDASKESNYDLASTISVCPGYRDFAVKEDLATPEPDLDKALLRPGFSSVSQFLTCLGYLQEQETDPLWAGTGADYQYRVSSDYSQFVAVALLELGKAANEELTGQSGPAYVRGNGSANRALYDDSDFTVAGSPNFFQAFEGRVIANSRYLYQCLRSADGKTLSLSERSDKKNAPFLTGEGGNGAANPACEDKPESLLTVSSR
jgi:hypothetical protein